MPESMWIIDPNDTHFVDVHVGVAGIPDRHSVVSVRNVMKLDAHDDHMELVDRVTLGCRAIRESSAKPMARAKSLDVGSMFALGTKVDVKKPADGGLPVYHKKTVRD